MAFGCILFSDEVFHVLQDALDHPACLIDDALKCGGHPVVSRPPGRVRDLIARFDPRALHWYGCEPPPLRLLQPPPSIEAITEPEALARLGQALLTQRFGSADESKLPAPLTRLAGRRTGVRLRVVRTVSWDHTGLHPEPGVS